MLVVCYLYVTIFCAVPNQGTTSQEGVVAAVIEGYPITESRVLRHLEHTLPARFHGNYSNAFKNEALAHLINRHLVLLSIELEKCKASKSELKFEMSKLLDRLREIEKDLSDYLIEQNISEKELKYELRWRIAWRKYLKRKLSDENLKQFFKRNASKYDGTQVRISHLLIQEKNGSGEERAKAAREEILTGKIAWRDAVRKYSDAESSKMADGDIGWVDFFGPMTPEFCQQCINLEINELSKPFRTKFGWHVAKCTDVKRGQVDFGDAKSSVQKDATQFLFLKLANKRREQVEIEMLSEWAIEDVSQNQK
ncbi:MAG: peptidylprolyl isomerase [Planctomycetota bacterium]